MVTRIIISCGSSPPRRIKERLKYLLVIFFFPERIRWKKLQHQLQVTLELVCWFNAVFKRKL